MSKPVLPILKYSLSFVISIVRTVLTVFFSSGSEHSISLSLNIVSPHYLIIKMDQSASDQSHSSIHQSSLSTSSNVDSGTSSTTINSSSSTDLSSASTGRRSFNRGRWLKEEDEKLRKLVSLYGDSNWNEISKYFQDRSDIQCQQRWDKVVNPELVKGPWTKEVSYFVM